MMSRTAETIYWLGRYMERIENHARLINTCFHDYHEWSGCETERRLHWQQLLHILGETDAYVERSDLSGEQGLLYYLTLDDKQPNSILNCLSKARQNARSIRERIPDFLWESVNETYHWLKGQDPISFSTVPPYLFYQHIKEKAALFFGIVDSSMLRQSEWHMLHCGRYVERAENMVRILRLIVDQYQKKVQSTNPSASYQYLITGLRAVDGLEGFRKFHAADMSMANVFCFLMINEIFPRSVLFSLLLLEQHLTIMKMSEKDFETSASKPFRMVKKLQGSLLDFSDDLTDTSQMEAFLQNLLISYNQLGREFSKSFFCEEV